MPTVNPDNTVIIMWRSSYSDDGYYNVLDSHDGIRVYKRDRYDPRAGDELPYFDDRDEALAYMDANRNQQAQVAQRVARDLYPTERFARFY